MEITVFGAGAIGGVVGAYLAKSRHQVLLVDSARDHVEAINRDGLLIDGLRGEFRVRARAVTPEDLPDSLDLVMLCVKAQNTAAAHSESRIMLKKGSVRSVKAKGSRLPTGLPVWRAMASRKGFWAQVQSLKR